MAVLLVGGKLHIHSRRLGTTDQFEAGAGADTKRGDLASVRLLRVHAFCTKVAGPS